MRKTLLFFVGTALVALVSDASAALTASGRSQAASSTRRLPAAKLGSLERTTPVAPELFSRTVLDPAHCNFQYVDYEGRMVVRSELKLTCTVKQ